MMETRALSPEHTITRIIRGGWQLAAGHGNTVSADAVADLVATADAGITSFDCADIYTGVEDTIGAFRTAYANARGEGALKNIRVHTKCVPDLDLLPRLTKADLEATVDRSRARLGMDRLDLVQFHWWDDSVDRWLEAAGWLAEMVEDGRILSLGGTNFGARHMRDMLAAGLPLRAMQVQYSLLDDRPSREMAGLGVPLLTYGTLAGGFLSDRWRGVREPDGTFENRSLVKYKLIIDDAGGWDAFQSLLDTLAAVAARHDTDIASIANRWMLDQPGVGAIIVGARNASHLARNVAVADLCLTDADRADIANARKSLTPLAGDVYDLERDRSSRHGAIMKYNLNRSAA